jgi:DNA-binding XRE family transcriptional regulator
MITSPYIEWLAARVYARAEGASTGWGNGDYDDRPLYRAYAVLALAKGVHVTSEDVHNAWSAYTMGWNPQHPDIVPFSMLPADKRAQDDVYRDAIHAVAQEWTALGLKTLRETSGQSLRRVAGAIGTSAGNLCRIENGYHEPGVVLALRIAEYFGVSVRSIFFPQPLKDD